MKCDLERKVSLYTSIYPKNLILVEGSANRDGYYGMTPSDRGKLIWLVFPFKNTSRVVIRRFMLTMKISENTQLRQHVFPLHVAPPAPLHLMYSINNSTAGLILISYFQNPLTFTLKWNIFQDTGSYSAKASVIGEKISELCKIFITFGSY